VIEGKIVKGERLFVTRNGAEFWADTVHVPIMIGNELRFILTNWVDITEQKRLQEQKERFTKKLMLVQEEERKRVAQELHDDIAQNLALLGLEVDSLVNDGEIESEKVLKRLKTLKENTERTINDARRYSHALRPGVLDYLGLEAAIEQLVLETREQCGIDIKLDVLGEERRLTDDIEMTFFRIAQEAVSNIRRHAQADTARLELEFWPNKLKLVIMDNGKGFDMGEISQAEPPTNNMGLIGMKERSRLIGADFKIEPGAGKGTTISLEIKT
jgi:signal transduction histidine kinase